MGVFSSWILMDLGREGWAEFIFSPLKASLTLCPGKEPTHHPENYLRPLSACPFLDAVANNSSTGHLWDTDAFMYNGQHRFLWNAVHLVNNGPPCINPLTSSLQQPCIAGLIAAFQMLLKRNLNFREVIIWPRLLSQEVPPWHANPCLLTPESGHIH